MVGSDNIRLNFVVQVLLLAFLLPSICFSQTDPSDELAFVPSEQGFITSWLQLGSIPAPPGIKKQNERLAELDPLGIANLDKVPRAGEMIGKV